MFFVNLILAPPQSLFINSMTVKNLYLPHTEKKDEEREIREVAINVELADGSMGLEPVGEHVPAIQRVEILRER